MADNKRLRSMHITPHEAKSLDLQVEAAVNLHEGRFTVRSTMRESFKQLARDCYFQGLMDGAQLFPGATTSIAPHAATTKDGD